jgi:acyl carrier protein
LAIENKFNIEITDEEADELIYQDGRKIKDLISLIEKKLINLPT